MSRFLKGEKVCEIRAYDSLKYHSGPIINPLYLDKCSTLQYLKSQMCM